MAIGIDGTVKIMLNIPRSIRVAKLIGLFALLVSSAAAQASLVRINFAVEVNTREVLDDGNFLTDWQQDAGFTGSGFSLSADLNTAAVLSERGNFGHRYNNTLTVPIFGMLSTPFDAEMDAVLTRWPGLGVGDASVTLLQRLDTNTNLAEITLRLNQSVGLVGNTPDVRFSTEQAQRFISLGSITLWDQIPVLSAAEVVSGALLEVEDLLAYLSRQPTFQLDFTQSAAQNQSAYIDLTTGGGFGQGVRYDGTASFASAQSVPISGTVWLFGCALFLLRRQALGGRPWVGVHASR